MHTIGRTVCAALAMGNACVLKPSEKACLSVLVFAELVSIAGLPSGALNVVPGLGAEAGEALSEHTSVNQFYFEGSTAIGTKIQASAAQSVVPVLLELNAKPVQSVFDDANIDVALPHLMNAGIQNAGQSGSASSRVLVQRGVYQSLVDKLVERYAGLKVGSAIHDHDMGPLISANQKEIFDKYVERGKDCLLYTSPSPRDS